jgi:Ubiquitin fusion degradation protein UFD1
MLTLRCYSTIIIVLYYTGTIIRSGLPSVSFVVVVAAAAVDVRRTMTTTTSTTTTPMVSLRSSANKIFTKRWIRATSLALLEQQVEDYNAEYIARVTSSSSYQNVAGDIVKHRRLICLPLDDRFDPPMGVFSHGHIQTGDKMSLPSCFWQSIQLNHVEVPWLFRIKRIEGVTGERIQYINTNNNITTTGSTAAIDDVITECKPMVQDLNEVIGGPLDFRAPSNYIFVPLWMMRALGLRPRDIVEVEQIETIPAGSMAKLRPHSSDFAKDISNPQAVLETELRHYSALVQGTTIAFDYNRKRYWFDVVELRSAPRGITVPMIKVQDCDIMTDFLPSKDVLMEQLKKKQQRQREKELEQQ